MRKKRGLGGTDTDVTAQETLWWGPLEKDAHQLQTQQHRGRGAAISGLARESHPGRQEKEKTETEQKGLLAVLHAERMKER